MGKGTGGKSEVAHVPDVKLNVRPARQMRGLFAEVLDIAGKDNHFRAKAEAVVGPGESFQQPAAEEARSARDEQAASAQLLPDGPCAKQDKVQIRR